jgi:hypothetical protein
MSNSTPRFTVSALHFFLKEIPPLASLHRAQSDECFFQLLIPELSPVFTAVKRIGVWNCHPTCGHRKTPFTHNLCWIHMATFLHFFFKSWTDLANKAARIGKIDVMLYNSIANRPWPACFQHLCASSPDQTCISYACLQQRSKWDALWQRSKWDDDRTIDVTISNCYIRAQYTSLCCAGRHSIVIYINSVVFDFVHFIIYSPRDEWSSGNKTSPRISDVFADYWYRAFKSRTY